MKVLLATHFFPPNHPGGTEAYTLGLAKRLRQVGHSPYVICAENWGCGDDWHPRYEDTVYEGIPVRRLYWNWQLAPDPFLYLYANPAVEAHLTRYLGQLQPDVVHTTSCYTLGGAAIQAARRAGRPSFLTLTDFWFLSPRQTLLRGDGTLCAGPDSPDTCAKCLAWDANVYRGLTTVLPADLVARGLREIGRQPRIARLRGLRGYVGDPPARFASLRRVFDDVDLAIAPSRALRDVYCSNGYPAERIQVARYGIDTTWVAQLRERSPRRPIRIGYVGQIEPVKGVDLLVRAFQMLAGNSAAELWIYGSSAKNPRYAADVRRLAGEHPRIRIKSAFERSEIADVFSELDVVVVPSVWYENAPLVIAESFAAHKPVIATNLSGMSELVTHEVNGLLFERGDVRGLAAALQRVIDDPTLLERLRAGIQPVRTIEREVDELVQLYQAELQMKARSRSDHALQPA